MPDCQRTPGVIQNRPRPPNRRVVSLGIRTSQLALHLALDFFHLSFFGLCVLPGSGLEDSAPAACDGLFSSVAFWSEIQPFSSRTGGREFFFELCHRIRCVSRCLACALRPRTPARSGAAFTVRIRGPDAPFHAPASRAPTWRSPLRH